MRRTGDTWHRRTPPVGRVCFRVFNLYPGDPQLVHDQWVQPSAETDLHLYRTHLEKITTTGAGDWRARPLTHSDLYRADAVAQAVRSAVA